MFFSTVEWDLCHWGIEYQTQNVNPSPSFMTLYKLLVRLYKIENYSSRRLSGSLSCQLHTWFGTDMLPKKNSDLKS